MSKERAGEIGIQKVRTLNRIAYLHHKDKWAVEKHTLIIEENKAMWQSS